MIFKIISNPPFNFGSKISDTMFRLSFDFGVFLMPFSCMLKSRLRGKNLMSYKYLSSYELCGNQFDAQMTMNLSILRFENFKTNLLDNEKQIYLLFSDKRFQEFYKKNLIGNKKYFFEDIRQSNYKEFVSSNRDKCFVDLRRVASPSKKGNGYKYNYKQSDYLSNFFGFIKFKSSQEKQNFCKYWYSDDPLVYKIMKGINFEALCPNNFYCIPQIDWIKIENNSLWKQEKYVEAVLDEMGLCYDKNSDIIKIKI